MADVVDETTSGAPAHGRAVLGAGKHHGLFSGPHREEIIAVCSVAGVLLMWLTLRATRKPAATGASADLSTSAGQAAYLGNSGSVAGFDEAAVQGLQDSLNTMQTNSQAQLDQLTGQLQSQADASTAAQAGLQNQLNAANASLGNLGTAVSQLPQQVVSSLPRPVAAPAPQPAPPVATGPAPSSPARSGPQYVTVNAGDNLSRIAARYSESWINAGSIGSLNGIHNLNLIHPGQRLRVY